MHGRLLPASTALVVTSPQRPLARLRISTSPFTGCGNRWPKPETMPARAGLMVDPNDQRVGQPPGQGWSNKQLRNFGSAENL